MAECVLHLIRHFSKLDARFCRCPLCGFGDRLANPLSWSARTRLSLHLTLDAFSSTSRPLFVTLVDATTIFSRALRNTFTQFSWRRDKLGGKHPNQIDQLFDHQGRDGLGLT